MVEIHSGTPGATRRASEPAGDPLPSAARAKLLALQGLATDARDAAASAQVRLRALQEQLSGSTLSDEEQDSIEHEIERLLALRAKSNERHAALLALDSSIRRYIQSLPRGTSLELVKHPAPKLLKDETFADALTRIRDQITTIKHHRHSVAYAPPPKSALKEAATTYVQQMAERGRPNVTAERDGLRVEWGDPRSFAPGGAQATAEMNCWLFPEQVLKRLSDEIDAMPAPANVLTATERKRRLADLGIELEQRERDEEALIEKATRDGAEILRRSDASPAAVLGIRIKQSARVRA